MGETAGTNTLGDRLAEPWGKLASVLAEPTDAKRALGIGRRRRHAQRQRR